MMSDCVLFFDIDGVLNNHDFNSESQSCTLGTGPVKAFNRILTTCQATLILASAWRYRIIDRSFSLKGFALMLRTHGVHACVADLLQGHLREDTMVSHGYGSQRKQVPMENERGMMVKEWLTNDRLMRRVNSVILDDMDLGYTAAGLRLVQPNGKVGLTEAEADRVIALFQRAQEAKTA